MQKILRHDEFGEQVTLSRGGILHTDIWLHTLKGSAELNQKLTKEIINHKQVAPTRDPMANPGCWRGSRDYQGWAILKKNIIANLKAIHKYYAQIGPPCMTLDNLPDSAFETVHWANVNEKGSTNAMHTHSKWHWSGVYYIQGTGTGKIALYSTPYINQQVSYGLPFGQSFTIDTADGLLLIFPSYLMHEVLANPSDRQRINIAFNVKIDLEYTS